MFTSSVCDEMMAIKAKNQIGIAISVKPEAISLIAKHFGAGLSFESFQPDNGSRHRAARVKLTIRKRADAAPVHGMVIRRVRSWN
ncbi:hypothetical protein [Rubripirellula tenax]|uniref:hypothetical protein n=1 Tax=Rubripirellula tenax TaxID=2528015 RepID=UPI0011B7E0FA|nr:hypothetical protein [Rubripirellula tenax]